MDHETNAKTLAGYTVEQWDGLLDATWSVGAPRRLVIVQCQDRVSKAPRLSDPSLTDRRALMWKLKGEGMNNATLARKFGVSPGLITKILKGERS
ncbi:hypothetical protein QH494_02575 [Sphingomonas sp. AR_OL41]|uniref:hypothetical protein n=1 Tax=Sphingomonas sp. AR_OL41 TaxID=3042729 RepID=UPI00248129A7|nr:hypothetical protein [Sphingomonas sp. AR_OL41]MDH7971054.1 hypothetical protein [Sphingomonas sp. AR_OL41]